MGKDKYIIVNKGEIPLSAVINDCPGELCVPTRKGETLPSILDKVCKKAMSLKECDPVFLKWLDTFPDGVAGKLLSSDGDDFLWVNAPVAGYTVYTVITGIYNETSTVGEKILLVDTQAAGSNVIINLPSALGNTSKYTIKKIDSGSNTVTVIPSGSQTIDGSTSATILYQNTRMTIISNNSNWFIIN